MVGREEEDAINETEILSLYKQTRLARIKQISDGRKQGRVMFIL